jgi:hypothetical protein
MSPSTIKITAISVVLFLVAAGGFTFMCMQTQQQGEELVAQLATLSEQRSQEESYFRLRRVAEESTVQREQLSRYFFSGESESIDFLNMVEKIAPSAGVKLETTSLNLVDDADDGKQWIEIGFLFEGSRSRVQNFLIVLEELPYVSEITKVDMQATDQTKWQSRVTMRVRVLNYDN